MEQPRQRGIPRESLEVRARLEDSGSHGPARSGGGRSTRRSLLGLAAGGALWGAVTYAVVWGYTSIVVTRQFVESTAGLVSLLPVRALLFMIHVVEDRIAHHPFDFSRNHDWIGLGAAAMGAALLVAPGALAFAIGHRWRVRRRVARDGSTVG